MTPATKAIEPMAKGSKTRSETHDFLTFLLKLGLFAFVLRSFIFAPFNIPSESMQPRLLIGDYLVVSKWPYGYSRYSMAFSLPIIPGRILSSVPERGDVVVFKAPPTNSDDYIKRVVGLPGDTIQMKNGVLHINGVAVPKQKVADLVIPVTANMVDAAAKDGVESPCFRTTFEEVDANGARLCRYAQFRETLPNGKSYNVLDVLPNGRFDDTAPVIVPADHIFLMGDNRDRSADSRLSHEEGGVSVVPMVNLVGRAQVSVFSTDGSAAWLLPWTWFTAARWDRIGEAF